MKKFKQYIETLSIHDNEDEDLAVVRDKSGCVIYNLKKNERVHISSNPNLEFKNIEQKPYTVKPDGLWYSCGEGWYKWCKSEKIDIQHQYVITINPENILFLDTAEKLMAFTEEYSVYKYASDKKREPLGNFVRWDKVGEKYSGVQMCPYIFSLRRELPWYYGMDIASGCIWNKDGLVDIRKVN